ncbi:MAG TPA: hypothetical protein VNL17_14680 [Verrucomicrobiae bacterium]|nr:hypothetical protein [Verrucomicrobiae bacterium]
MKGLMDNSEQLSPMDRLAVGLLIESAAPDRDRLIHAQADLAHSLYAERTEWRTQALRNQWGAALLGCTVGVIGSVLLMVLCGGIR